MVVGGRNMVYLNRPPNQLPLLAVFAASAITFTRLSPLVLILLLAWRLVQLAQALKAGAAGGAPLRAFGPVDPSVARLEDWKNAESGEREEREATHSSENGIEHRFYPPSYRQQGRSGCPRATRGELGLG